MSDNIYADLVAAQAVEIERLTRERDEAEATACRLGKQMLDERRAKLTAEAERDALRAWQTIAECNQQTAQSWQASAVAADRNAARLREALTDLVEEVEEYELGNPDTLRRARAALGGKP